MNLAPSLHQGDRRQDAAQDQTKANRRMNSHRSLGPKPYLQLGKKRRRLVPAPCNLTRKTTVSRRLTE
jgi:hypothetical protein